MPSTVESLPVAVAKPRRNLRHVMTPLLFDCTVASGVFAGAAVFGFTGFAFSAATQVLALAVLMTGQGLSLRIRERSGDQPAGRRRRLGGGAGPVPEAQRQGVPQGDDAGPAGLGIGARRLRSVATSTNPFRQSESVLPWNPRPTAGPEIFFCAHNLLKSQYSVENMIVNSASRTRPRRAPEARRPHSARL